MKKELSELESIFTNNLKLLNTLKYDVEKKETEKNDLLKEISNKIIDVIDSFELIEDNFKERGLVKNEYVVKSMNRYKTIQRRLYRLLADYHITKMEFPEKRLIVGWCEVVGTEPDNSKQNEEIITIIKNGYCRFKKDVIREEQVITVQN